MLFTVELINWDFQYRLQKDGTWRCLENRRILSSTDYLTDKRLDVLRISKNKGTIELDGNLFVIEADTMNIGSGSKDLSYSSMVFRNKFPAKPKEEKLRNAIRSGDDSRNNSLILNVYGQFKLRRGPPFYIFKNDPTLVARYETFDAGAGYVGLQSASDNSYIKELYHVFLDFWLNHLKEGRTGMYIDIPALKTLEHIENDLSQLQAQWTAQY